MSCKLELFMCTARVIGYFDSAVQPPSEDHRGTVVFLHGLGSSGRTCMKDFEHYGLFKKLPNYKFVFPTAPFRDITAFNQNHHKEHTLRDVKDYEASAQTEQSSGGESGQNVHIPKIPAWYNFKTLDPNDPDFFIEDLKGMEESADKIRRIIKKEQRYAPVYLGGFSQGAAMAIFTYLLYPDLNLRGVSSLHGPFAGFTMLDKFKMNNNPLKIYYQYSSNDPVVTAPISNATLYLLTGDGKFNRGIPERWHDVINRVSNRKHLAEEVDSSDSSSRQHIPTDVEMINLVSHIQSCFKI